MWLIQPFGVYIWLAVVVVAFLVQVVTFVVHENTNQFSNARTIVVAVNKVFSNILKLAVYTLPIPVVCNIIRIFVDYSKRV